MAKLHVDPYWSVCRFSPFFQFIFFCFIYGTKLILAFLQQIWDEVGETEEERDRMLLQLEQDCLDVYKRKVDQAVKSRAHLLQTLADARVVLTNLLSSLGEKTYVGIVST